MKKIPTVFKIIWHGYNRGEVLREISPGSEWVVNGEGIPTRKYDGTSCLYKNKQLYKRYDRKKVNGEYKPAPEGWFEAQSPDEITDHWPGWVLIGPTDYYHKEGLQNTTIEMLVEGQTYELVGPKINGNPDGFEKHILVPHGKDILIDLPGRSYDEIRDYLSKKEIEGIVFHHPDGRMSKIKRSDFGFEWPIKKNKKNVENPN